MARFDTIQKPMTEHTYKEAGVDIDAGNDLVKQIGDAAKRTQDKKPGVLAGIGGFGALFELPLDRYQKPVIVSSTDGVGTKLELAHQLDKHDTIGIDLVAMCANDILTQGAEPLFFLDYYATGKLNVAAASAVIQGIAKGCEIAQMALIGGETAEMPGLYQGGSYDLAGFCVGIVEKSKIIDGSTIVPGDKLIALASSGPHANGYSLVRRVIDAEKINITQTLIDGQPLAERLLTPTRIYVESILSLLKHCQVKGMSHITGGGLLENVPRMLPRQTQAVIDQSTWTWPTVFQWLTDHHVPSKEMYRTFNCGVGMVLCVAPENVGSCLALLESTGETAWAIGEVRSVENDVRIKIV